MESNERTRLAQLVQVHWEGRIPEAEAAELAAAMLAIIRPVVANMLRGGSRHDIDDVVQDAWMRALGALDGLEDANRANEFVRSVARRAVADYFKKKKRDRAYVVESGDDHVENSPTKHPALDRELWAAGRWRLAEQAIPQPRSRDRRVVYARFVEGWSSKEVGEREGMSEVAVNNLVQRVKQRMRAQFPSGSPPDAAWALAFLRLDPAMNPNGPSSSPPESGHTTESSAQGASPPSGAPRLGSWAKPTVALGSAVVAAILLRPSGPKPRPVGTTSAETSVERVASAEPRAPLPDVLRQAAAVQSTAAPVGDSVADAGTTSDAADTAALPGDSAGDRRGSPFAPEIIDHWRAVSHSRLDLVPGRSNGIGGAPPSGMRWISVSIGGAGRTAVQVNEVGTTCEGWLTAKGGLLYRCTGRESSTLCYAELGTNALHVHCVSQNDAGKGSIHDLWYDASGAAPLASKSHSRGEQNVRIVAGCVEDGASRVCGDKRLLAYLTEGRYPTNE